jgi:hypothetical protein
MCFSSEGFVNLTEQAYRPDGLSGRNPNPGYLGDGFLENRVQSTSIILSSKPAFSDTS